MKKHIANIIVGRVDKIHFKFTGDLNEDESQSDL